MTVTEFAQHADTVAPDDLVEWDTDPSINGLVVAIDPAAALVDSEGNSVTGTADDAAVLIALNDESGAPTGESKVYLMSEISLMQDDTDAVLAGEGAEDEMVDDTMVEDAMMMATEDPRIFDFECVLVIEGAESGDRRFVELGALTWRDLPIPLMLQTTTPEASGHAGAIICGSIHDITRVGNQIVGRGFFDSGDNGTEARRLVSEGTMRGVSADIDMVEAAVEIEEGQLAGGVSPKMVLNAGRIMGATMTPFPAFQEAQMKLVETALVASARTSEFAYNFEDRDQLQVWSHTIPFNVSLDPEKQPLVASGRVLSLTGEFPGGPARPPASWFDPPKLTELTPMQVSADGQVFGHIAKWGQCHIGFAGQCVTPPRSNCNYRWFRNKQTMTAEGKTVWTGPIYGNLPDHAPLDLIGDQAQRWMAATGAASADVAVYEDRFGIVVAGAVRPDATAGQVRALQGSDVSPDWRPIEGRREMVGLVSVNTSGFIVAPPASALVASGLPASAFQTAGPAAGEMTVSWDFEKDEPKVLVAVGMVRHSEAPLDQLARRLHEVEQFLLPLRAEAVFSNVLGGSRLPFDQQFGREIHDVRTGKLLGSKKGDGNSDDSTPRAAIATLEDVNFHDEAAVLRETTDPDVIAGGIRLADGFEGGYSAPADYPNFNGDKSPVDSLREYGKGAPSAPPNISQRPERPEHELLSKGSEGVKDFGTTDHTAALDHAAAGGTAKIKSGGTPLTLTPTTGGDPAFAEANVHAGNEHLGSVAYEKSGGPSQAVAMGPTGFPVNPGTPMADPEAAISALVKSSRKSALAGPQPPSDPGPPVQDNFSTRRAVALGGSRPLG